MPGVMNALSRKFYFCSDTVKNTLLSYYCSNVYLCSLWVKYNNVCRIMHRLPMRCSASLMFVNARVDSCEARIRKCIYIQYNGKDLYFDKLCHNTRSDQ